MSTEDFITELFCPIDDKMENVEKQSQDSLYPSEVVTLALLFALKGVSSRAFYRWLVDTRLSSALSTSTPSYSPFSSV